MSKPRTPFADVEASLDSAKRAWIQEMLAALGKVQSVTVALRRLLQQNHRWCEEAFLSGKSKMCSNNNAESK